MLSYRKKKGVHLIHSHAEHPLSTTTGAADRLVINEKGQRERAGGEIDTERKAGNNREKERDADRLSSPPPLDNLGGEDTQTRRREHRTMLQAQLHVKPIIMSNDYLNSHEVCYV